jgi:hypothetical protein
MRAAVALEALQRDAAGDQAADRGDRAAQADGDDPGRRPAERQTGDDDALASGQEEEDQRRAGAGGEGE